MTACCGDGGSARNSTTANPARRYIASNSANVYASPPDVVASMVRLKNAASGGETLLAKAHRALVPGGRAVAVEFVPDEDRVSPPDAALFSLTMLATTSGGDAYTFAELEAMYRQVGFNTVELRALPPSPQQAVIGRA